MRIGFVSDLHGSQRHYDEVTRFVRDQRPDLLVLGGDIFPDGEEGDPPASQVEFVRSRFAAQLAHWRAAHAAMTPAIILGNHDWLPTRAALAEMHDRKELILLDGSIWTRDGVGFLGFSHTPPTPWWVKDFERLDRLDDTILPGDAAFWNEKAGAVEHTPTAAFYAARPTLSDMLDAAPLPGGRWFFICHAPPAQTALDRLPTVPHPVGSWAVREFIERTRPICSLHGHIHESPDVTGRYTERVGATLCINPGQNTDRLHAVWFESGDPLATLRHTVYA